MASTKSKTLTKSKSRSLAQGQNSAVINPYALAELIAGRRISWKELSDAPRVLEQLAFANPGSHLSSFFVYTPPRFNFNPSEQMLLNHSLMGETSEQLARSLFISTWTVKKRWHAIYQRVADVDAELLLPPVTNTPDATGRGTERRRHLLHYLRQHLEELRPLSR